MQAQPPPGLVITPMGVGEVLDSAFTLARRNFRLLATIAAWGLVPGYLLQGVLSAAFYIGADSSRGPSVAAFAGAGGGIISGLAASLATIATMVGCVRIIVPTAEGRPTAGQAYREALSRIPAFLLLAIIFGICSFALVFLLVVPAVYVGVRWIPAYSALIAERTGPITALGRGWNLSRGVWWHTAMTLFLSGIAIALVQMVTAGVFGAGIAILAVAVNALALSAILWAIVNAVASIIATPFSAAVAIVLYYELRARAEGFDLEQRIGQLPPAE